MIRTSSSLASSWWAASPALVAIIVLGVATPTPGAHLPLLVASLMFAALAMIVVAVGAVTRYAARATTGPAFDELRAAIPRVSDPDAAGHVRPRAPGIAPVR